MTDSLHPRRAGRRFLVLATAGFLVILVAACGGASTPAGSAAGSSGSGDGNGGDTGTDVGEPYDPAVIEGAADVLATVPSYVYEATIVQTGGSGTRTQTVHGIVRTTPTEARAVTYTADGDTIGLLYVDGKDYADYGDGFQAVASDAGTREDTDPLAVRALYGSFSGVSDDMIVAGTETTHDIATVHLVMDPEALAAQRADLGEGAEGWIAELWLAQADGQLVKAIWGGPLAPPPPAFSPPNYTIDVTDTDCECPVTAPS